MIRPRQHWDPQRYARNASFVAEHGAPVLELLAPAAGQRILDLGCGDGALSAKLVAMGARVVGIDASAAQIEGARARGLDAGNFEARVMGGEELAFDCEFDAVFSNAALHWMKDAPAVIDGVWRALEPGGRFVGEMGGEGNVASVRGALHRALRSRGLDPRSLDPWFFPDAGEYRALLEARGFAVASIELFARPTPIPGPIEDWLDTFAESFVLALPAGERDTVKSEVADNLRAELCDEAGQWTIDYVRLRFSALKPA
ncbi:MAG: class I SAM-dependent methyltransferase [Alphaproteobacteria bacterium]